MIGRIPWVLWISVCNVTKCMLSKKGKKVEKNSKICDDVSVKVWDFYCFATHKDIHIHVKYMKLFSGVSFVETDILGRTLHKQRKKKRLSCAQCLLEVTDRHDRTGRYDAKTMPNASSKRRVPCTSAWNRHVNTLNGNRAEYYCIKIFSPVELLCRLITL